MPGLVVYGSGVWKTVYIYGLLTKCEIKMRDPGNEVGVRSRWLDIGQVARPISSHIRPDDIASKNTKMCIEVMF